MEESQTVFGHHRLELDLVRQKQREALGTQCIFRRQDARLPRPQQGPPLLRERLARRCAYAVDTEGRDEQRGLDATQSEAGLGSGGPANREGRDGEDRSPELLGTPRTKRSRPLFWEYDRNDTSFDYPTVRNCARGGDRSSHFAVRDGCWKLLVNADGTGAELYDLSTDPAESKELAANRPQQATRLTKLVRDWRNRCRDTTG